MGGPIQPQFPLNFSSTCTIMYWLVYLYLKFHFLKYLTKNGTIEIIYCKSKNQVVDISLKLKLFIKLKKLLGVYIQKENVVMLINIVLRERLLNKNSSLNKNFL